MSEFIAIEPLHNQVHEIGMAIVQAYKTGDKETAQKLCVVLLATKDNILTMLSSLQQAVRLQANEISPSGHGG